MNRQISIGAAARISGVKAPTIRYFEQIGLLPVPPRTEGNRRYYELEDLRRLAFIRRARELGSRSRRSGPCWRYRMIHPSPAPRRTQSPARVWPRSSSASPACRRSNRSLR